MAKLKTSGIARLGKREELFAFFFCGLILFRILLDAIYKSVVAPYFGYSGFYNKETTLLWLISWILCLLVAVIGYRFFKNEDDSISGEVLYIIMLLSAVPFTSMVRFGAFTTPYLIANTLFFTVLAVASRVISPPRGAKAGSVPLGGKVTDGMIHCIFAVTLLIVIYVSGRYAHFRTNFNLLKVYELRSEAKSLTLPTLVRYLFGWARAVNTVLIAYYIRKKKYALAALAFIGQILSFGFDGSKSVFFYALIAVGVNILPRMKALTLNKLALAGIVALMAVCLLHHKLTGDYFLASLFGRRLMFLPAQLGQNYFDYFTHHTPDFYRGSFLKHFGFTTPYPNLVYLIGEAYYSKPSMGANNGLISDAITNMGVIGIVIQPTLIVLVLKFFDRASKGLDPRIYITTSLYMSIVLINSFLPVVLLTHGAVLLIILLAMMSGVRTKSGKEKKPVRRLAYEGRDSRRGQAAVYQGGGRLASAQEEP